MFVLEPRNDRTRAGIIFRLKEHYAVMQRCRSKIVNRCMDGHVLTQRDGVDDVSAADDADDL